MLTRIHIQNFAISTEAGVDLSAGLSILTGETGAGKSILIDALNLVLGDRAEAGVVRYGADKATINASFELAPSSHASQWLINQEMDDGNECHIRRIITAEGRSRAFINGNACSLGLLRTLGEMLVDIHGQHEHQSLTKSGRQRELLDHAGQHDTLLQKLSVMATGIRQTEAELNRLIHDKQSDSAQLELLQYQIHEMDHIGLDEIDIPAIEQEYETLSHTNSLKEIAWQAREALTEAETSAITRQTYTTSARLEPWLNTHPTIKSTYEILQEIQVLAEEADGLMGRLADELESDPRRMEELDNLLAELHNLARKHHCPLRELPHIYTEKSAQLASYNQDENHVKALQTSLDELKKHYEALSAELHHQRKITADELSAQVTRRMQELGMRGGRFEISVEHKPEEAISVHGQDHICFLVSANPGQPPQPLAKVASGGELSRISLAVTVTTTDHENGVPTLIFDEVDSGIGGAVAEIVGKSLRALSSHKQVLCVTHLPQVASQGHNHYRITKTSSDNHTESRIITLDKDSRIQEIARMLGGVHITEKSLMHARELLQTGSAARDG